MPLHLGWSRSDGAVLEGSWNVNITIPCAVARMSLLTYCLWSCPGSYSVSYVLSSQWTPNSFGISFDSYCALIKWHKYEQVRTDELGSEQGCVLRPTVYGCAGCTLNQTAGVYFLSV